MQKPWPATFLNYHRIIGKVLQTGWRWTRSHTLGAQGIVLDDANRVLLVRHGYRPGWHLPGGGVEKNEIVESAMRRELREEAGVEVKGTPELFGIFANFEIFPGDHVVVYVIRSWSQARVPEPNHEILEQRFYSRSELPRDIAMGARRRLDELFDGKPRQGTW